MSVKECSKVLGAAPGLYDGIYSCSGLPTGNKGQTTADWVNINGAIIVNTNYAGRISNIRVFHPQQYYVKFYLHDLIYDRTIMRVCGSNWWAATLSIIFLTIGASIVPAFIMAKVSRLHGEEVIYFGLIISAIMFVAFGIFSRSWWTSHHEPIFADRQVLIGASTLVAITTLYLWRIWQLQTKSRHQT